MASTLMAIRHWNRESAGSTGRTSRSRNSRMASRSSPAAGRLGGISAPGAQQGEEVVQRLLRAAADRQLLQRSRAAAQMTLALHHAHHAPLEAAEHLPEEHCLRVDAHPGRSLVRLEELVPVTEAAHRRAAAEAPGPHAQPAEVGHRIPDVRDLPVEDGPDPVWSHDEVAIAEVAVHEAPSRRLGRALADPAKAQLDIRLRVVEAAPAVPVDLELGSRVLLDQEGEVLDRHGVDASQDLTTLPGHDPAGRREPLVPVDPGPEGLGLDPLRHVTGAETAALVAP